MKYYLVRNGVVVGNVELTKSTRLIIDETMPNGDEQYLIPEIILDKVTDLEIKTSVEEFGDVFAYEKPASELEIDTDIEPENLREK